MKSLDEVLKNKNTGLHYGNRIILPFTGYILKAVVDKEIVTDFGPASSGASINETPDFIEIYFLDYPELSETISEFESIKLVVVEKGKDVFDFKNHRKIALHLKEKHSVEIEEINEDILFIE